MKLLIATSIAAALATAALADKSDRYNDLRLDTAKGHISATDDAGAKPVALSSKNKSKSKPSYAYTNRFGVGPYNDSR